MAEIKKSLELDVPVAAAYDQWSRFESFPIFMDNVKRVEQLRDDEVLFHAHVQGINRSWTARIVKDEPNREIEWRSIEGLRNHGRVLFEPLGQGRTRVTLLMEYEPEDWKEKLGQMTGLLDRRVMGDLGRFKNFMERKEQSKMKR